MNIDLNLGTTCIPIVGSGESSIMRDIDSVSTKGAARILMANGGCLSKAIATRAGYWDFPARSLCFDPHGSPGAV
jgi:hypothetical protein